MKVISAALTNEQKMSVFVCMASHFPAHISRERLQRRPIPLSAIVLRTCGHSAPYLGMRGIVVEQGRSPGKCKWVEWISRSKCRLCIKLFKGRVPAEHDTPQSLCFRGDWEFMCSNQMDRKDFLKIPTSPRFEWCLICDNIEFPVADSESLACSKHSAAH